MKLRKVYFFKHLKDSLSPLISLLLKLARADSSLSNLTSTNAISLPVFANSLLHSLLKLQKLNQSILLLASNVSFKEKQSLKGNQADHRIAYRAKDPDLKDRQEKREARQLYCCEEGSLFNGHYFSPLTTSSSQIRQNTHTTGSKRQQKPRAHDKYIPRAQAS